MYRVFDTVERIFCNPNEILISCSDDKLLTCGNSVLGWHKLTDLEDGRYIVHQFIGVYDKNGNPIYSGDICELESSSGDVIYCTVAYMPSMAAYLLFDENNGVYYHFDEYIVKDMTVMGNVFDKPEMSE